MVTLLTQCIDNMVRLGVSETPAANLSIAKDSGLQAFQPVIPVYNGTRDLEKFFKSTIKQEK